MAAIQESPWVRGPLACRTQGVFMGERTMRIDAVARMRFPVTRASVSVVFLWLLQGIVAERATSVGDTRQLLQHGFASVRRSVVKRRWLAVREVCMSTQAVSLKVVASWPVD